MREAGDCSISALMVCSSPEHGDTPLVHLLLCKATSFSQHLTFTCGLASPDLLGRWQHDSSCSMHPLAMRLKSAWRAVLRGSGTWCGCAGA